MKLSFRIKRDIDIVFDYLTDMEKFVSVHPAISQMDIIGNYSYLVHETLKFGLIPFSFTYSAIVEKNETDKSVTMVATVFKVTKIEMKFTLESDHEHTIINEEIQFNTIIPVKPIMAKVFSKQHGQLFRNIELLAL